jgi:hypothetical protein
MPLFHKFFKRKSSDNRKSIYSPPKGWKNKLKVLTRTGYDLNKDYFLDNRLYKIDFLYTMESEELFCLLVREIFRYRFIPHYKAARDKFSEIFKLLRFMEGSKYEPFKKELDTILDYAIHKEIRHKIRDYSAKITRKGEEYSLRKLKKKFVKLFHWNTHIRNNKRKKRNQKRILNLLFSLGKKTTKIESLLHCLYIYKKNLENKVRKNPYLLKGKRNLHSQSKKRYALTIIVDLERHLWKNSEDNYLKSLEDFASSLNDFEKKEALIILKPVLQKFESNEFNLILERNRKIEDPFFLISKIFTYKAFLEGEAVDHLSLRQIFEKHYNILKTFIPPQIKNTLYKDIETIREIKSSREIDKEDNGERKMSLEKTFLLRMLNEY